MTTSSEGVRPVVIFLAPCPSCGVEATWHARQSEEPTPQCKRPTCRTEQLVEK